MLNEPCIGTADTDPRSRFRHHPEFFRLHLNNFWVLFRDFCKCCETVAF